AAVSSIIWQRTYGFGLQGELSPEATISAAASLSCMNAFGGEFYQQNGMAAKARCPSGATHSRRYRPDGGHDPAISILVSQQALQAFQRWWTFQSTYRYYTALEFWLDEVDIAGSTATVRTRVTLRTEGGFMPGDRRFHIDSNTEQWNVR